MKLKNPEFQRNIWLELSLNRIIFMPVILGCVFFLTYLFNRDNLSNLHYSLKLISISSYGVLVLLWGSKLVVDSVISEWNSHTWDAQRLTLISPWKMAIGKLFGSSIYQWYGGLFCLLFYFMICIMDGSNIIASLESILFLVLISICIHSVGLLISLLGMNKTRNKVKINSTGYFIFILIWGGCMLSFFFSHFFRYTNYSPIYDNQLWYFLSISRYKIMLFFAAYYAVWSIMGLYRAMRTEFKYENGAKVWFTFLLLTLVLNLGLIFNSEKIAEGLYIGLLIFFMALVGVIYLLAFFEPKYIVDIRKFIQVYKSGHLKKILTKSPLWLLTFAFLIGILFPLLILGNFLQLDWYDQLFIDQKITLSFPIQVVLFLIRDLCVLLYFNFNKNTKRADLSFILYLGLIYGILPSILNLLRIDEVLVFFWPEQGNSIIQLFVLLAEVLIGFYLMRKRFMSRNSEIK